MMRSVLTLLTALAMLLHAMTGQAVSRDDVAAPICHTGGDRTPGPGDTPHDRPVCPVCPICPICAAMAQPAVIMPPVQVVPRLGRVATITHKIWSAPPVVFTRTWTSWPRGPPRVV